MNKNRKRNNYFKSKKFKKLLSQNITKTKHKLKTQHDLRLDKEIRDEQMNSLTWYHNDGILRKLRKHTFLEFSF